MEKEVIKEIHHHHHHYYPCYLSTPLRYPGVWHSILPPPVVDANWYYQPSSTKIYTDKVVRYDSI